MITLNAIGFETKQSILQILPNNEIYKIDLFFQNNQKRWYMSLYYDENEIFYKRKIVPCINIAIDKKNIIPYGIFVDSIYKIAPNTKTFFSEEKCFLHIITSAEEEALFSSDIYKL